MAGSGALVSLFECTLSASMNPDCGCGEADCECEGSAADEASCPQCVKGNILKELQNQFSAGKPLASAMGMNGRPVMFKEMNPSRKPGLFPVQSRLPEPSWQEGCRVGGSPAVKDRATRKARSAKRHSRWEHQLTATKPYPPQGTCTGQRWIVVSWPELASAGMDVGTPNDDPESPSLQGWGRLQSLPVSGRSGRLQQLQPRPGLSPESLRQPEQPGHACQPRSQGHALGEPDLAQRTKKYENDLKSGAPESTINYDLGQLKASEQNYQNKVEAAHTAGLIAGGDEANRLQTLNDLSQTTDLLNQYHNAQGQATQPWLPGPGGGGTWIPGPGGGGLNLPEGPILIVNDPNLPAGVMTQIGPSLVAIGTGGQGDFMVQPGSPSDLGYPPPITNVPPVPEAGGAAAGQYAGQALVMNPETTGVTISFLIDQAPYSLPAGQELPLAGQPSWVIAFDRGGSLGPTSYTLMPAVATNSSPPRAVGIWSRRPTRSSWTTRPTPTISPSSWRTSPGRSRPTRRWRSAARCPSS